MLHRFIFHLYAIEFGYFAADFWFCVMLTICLTTLFSSYNTFMVLLIKSLIYLNFSRVGNEVETEEINPEG